MRVACIHPFLFRLPRGIERYTFNLANTLTRRDIQVDLLTWRWQTPIRINGLDSRVRVSEFPTSRYYAAQAIVPFYVWDLLTHRYDFVWIFFAGFGEVEALTLVRQQKFGIVFHYPYSQVPHRYREFQRFGLAQRAEKIVSVSRFVAEGVREALGRDSVVIHHGVDAERFAPNLKMRKQVRQSLNLPPDENLLVTAAALEERKGVQWVIRAIPHVLREFPLTTYLVLGDGAYRAELELLARELGVSERVRFLGVQSEVAPFFQAADLSLILSRGEASSLTALESLGCGTPVIAAQRPPFDELLSPEYGLMVNEEDNRQVAAMIASLLNDPTRRQKMGGAGRARILTDFTWERVGEQYLQLMAPG
ncbi:MAG: glycosyltransferase family 4 protein [Chloroflexi bacterium]|nr:glycosyltransferase family 4 protein [Chloroflexota bacterium]